jgi:hypothetical protein
MLLVFTLSVCGLSYADDIDDFLDGPPYPGGLPACLGYLATSHAEHALCQAELEVFEGEISACQQVVTDLQGEISTLEAQLADCQAAAVIPGDGVSGTPYSCTDTGNTVICANGLEWMKKNLTGGSVHHRDNRYTYAQALQWIADRNSEEYEGGGWRLPDRFEAMLITRYDSGFPVIPAVFGPVSLTTLTYYWTSTPDAGDPSFHFVQDFRQGLTDRGSSTALFRVMAVR